MLLQPFCLADWIRWIPSGLDVHRFDNVLVAGIREVIFQQVVLGNRAHVAFQSRRQEMLLEPRVFVTPEIPKVMVRVDHRLRNRHRALTAGLAPSQLIFEWSSHSVRDV